MNIDKQEELEGFEENLLESIRSFSFRIKQYVEDFDKNNSLERGVWMIGEIDNESEIIQKNLNLLCAYYRELNK